MKVQIVFLNPEDDIHSTRDMLSWVKAPRVLLVWPERGSVLSRRLDLVLLKRTSDHRRIEIGLVTFDKKIREEALQLGIPVFDSMDDLPEEKWSVQQPSGVEYHSGMISDLESSSLPDDPEKQIGWFGKLSRTSKAILVGTFLLLYALSIAVLIPSAKVILSPSLSTRAFSLEVDLLSERMGISNDVRISIQTVVLRSKGESTRNTSGLAQVPQTAAVGYVTFTSHSQESIEIPAGTTLRTSLEDGIRFKTVQSANLRDEIGAEVQVPIQALTLGWRGNVPAKSISLVDGPLGLLVQVSNKEPTEGGRNEIRGMVLQQDLDQLEKELMKELMYNAEREWYDSIPSGQVPVRGSLELRDILEREFDHVCGEVADTVTLELDLEFSALALSEKGLQNLVRIRFLDPLSSEYLPVPGGFTYFSHVQEPWEGSEDRRMVVEVEVDTYHTLDAGKIRSIIRGQRPSAAKESFNGYLLSSPPEIHIKPSWYPFLPLVNQRIDLDWNLE